VIKPLAELYEEARKINNICKDTPTVPQKAGEVFHVVSMAWY